VVVVGACIKPDTVMPASAIVKELTLSFVFAYRPSEFAHSLALLADGRVDGEAWITGRVGLDGVPEAFDQLRRPEALVKVLMTQ